MTKLESRVELTAAEKLRLDQVAQARELLRSLGYQDLPDGSLVVPGFHCETMKDQISIIMQGKVVNLVKLTESQFDFVLAMLYAARYFHALEVKPIEKKRKDKHGK